MTVPRPFLSDWHWPDPTPASNDARAEDYAPQSQQSRPDSKPALAVAKRRFQASKHALGCTCSDCQAMAEANTRDAYRRLVATETAQSLRYRETHAYVPLDATSFPDLLDEPDEGELWRIDEIMPAGSITVLAAASGAGKTTLVLNLIRAFTTRKPFLGYRTFRPNGRIVYLHTDRMPRRIFRSWTRRLCPDANAALIDIDDPTHLDILDPENRAALAADLRARSTAFLVIDSALPLLAALDLDENSNNDVRRWLDALRSLQRDAGIGEVLILHHAGHGDKARSRGASAWQDSTDVTWIITHDPDDHERQFTIPIGRGVLPVRFTLAFDERTLIYSNGGAAHSKTQRRDAANALTVENVLRANDGPLALGELADITGLNGRTVRKAVDFLESAGAVTPTRDGRRTLVRLIPEIDIDLLGVMAQ